MSLTQAAIERLPGVAGTLYSLTPTAEKPHNLACDPPPGVPRTPRSSFEDPTAPAHLLSRGSIELRVPVFHAA